MRRLVCPIPAAACLAALALCCLAFLACRRGLDNSAGSGTFEAVEVDLGALAAGRLLTLSKQEGDLVSRDELLATVDCEKLEIERDLVLIQQESAALQLELARKKVSETRIRLANDLKTLERIQALQAQKSATDQQLDEVSTLVELDRNRQAEALKSLEGPQIQSKELEARLRLLDRGIQDSKVFAPLDGQVIMRYAEPGEVVTVGRPLLRVADLTSMEIRVYLDPETLGEIKLGQKARVRPDGTPGKEFEGTVVWVSPKAEFTPKNVQTRKARADLVYAVKIDVPNPDGVLKIGMPADIFFD